MPTKHDDEATLVLPDNWLRRLHPRRGGARVPVPVIGPAAGVWLARLIEEKRARLDAVLGHPQSDEALVTAAHRYLDGADDPAGAAAVAATVVGPDDEPALVDAWAAHGGAAFAACAFAESHALAAPWQHDRLFLLGDDERGFLGRASARHLRAILAAATDDVHRDAVERLAAHRRTWFQRLVTAYLVPGQADWADEACAAPPDRDLQWIRMCVASDAAHLGSIGAEIWPPHRELGLLATMAEGLGALAAPVIDRTLAGVPPGRRRGPLFEVLAAVPSDEAMTGLIHRLHDDEAARAALLASMERFPQRATRLLAGHPGLSELLDDHVRARPEAAAACLPRLDARARAVVEPLTRAYLRVPDAPGDVLPSALVNPPWTREKPKETPVVLVVPAPDHQAVVWMPDEREHWASTVAGYPADWHQADRRRSGVEYAASLPPAPDDDPVWAERVEEFRAGHLVEYRQVAVLAHGPASSARRLLQGWFPEDWEFSSATDRPEEWMRILVARYELDALPAALRFARSKPGRLGGLLLPCLDAEVAALMAGWSLRGTAGSGTAAAWFERHGHRAAPLLVPVALGRPGARRRGAEWGLRQIAAGHGRETVVEAAAVHGDAAREAIAALLERDLHDLAPRKIPRLPAGTAPSRLPQIRLRERELALPEQATAHFLTMLLMSTPSEPAPGVDQVKAVCDPKSLAAFAWELFQRGDELGFVALGLLGDDDAVRRIGPLIRTWPGEGRHARAVRGLDVLAAIGSEAALTELDAISRKVRFKALKAQAREKMTEVAGRLGLSAEQLADRLVPDLGLDDAGELVLDYGPRRFTVGFDERLRPLVADENGTRRKALPRPGARDDATLAQGAYERFTRLKKDVRTIATDQIARLELAMVTGRRWSPREFEALFVRHPLMWHIARRLVWTSGGTAFRLAEDRTCADVHDDALAPGEAIALAHPLDLGADLRSWAQVFADYELLQPFEQLGRTVHTLTDEERATGRLRRFEGATTTSHRVWGLVRRGWERGSPEDNGFELWISRPLPDGRHVVAALDPGIPIADPSLWIDQTLTHVWFAERPGWFRDTGARPLGTVPAAVVSEVIADLIHLTAKP